MSLIMSLHLATTPANSAHPAISHLIIFISSLPFLAWFGYVSKLAGFLAKFKFFSLFLFLGVSRYFGQFSGSQARAGFGCLWLGLLHQAA
jgi:hypothetical protein